MARQLYLFFMVLRVVFVTSSGGTGVRTVSHWLHVPRFDALTHSTTVLLPTFSCQEQIEDEVPGKNRTARPQEAILIVTRHLYIEDTMKHQYKGISERNTVVIIKETLKTEKRS